MKWITSGLVLGLGVVLAMPAMASDWTGFRGCKQDGVATDANPPVKWSKKENIKWKLKLPGPGSSSPIVLGDHVYVTCYTGYGGEQFNGGPKDLKRHLLCVARKTGDIVWQKAVPTAVAVDPYRGFITDHGYASSTPVTDGENIYVFFGKTGVLAFNRKGKELWRTSVGTDSGPMRWGSGTSPILYKDMIIVSAAYESESVRALDKKTGKEIWKAEGYALQNAYGSPVIATLRNGTDELILSAQGEVWGLYPKTGKLKWYAQTGSSGALNPTPLVYKDKVFVTGGRNGRSFLFKAGGKGEQTKAALVWKVRYNSNVSTPVLYKDHLYWAGGRNSVYCLNAKSGKLVYEESLNIIGGGAGFGGSFYASPVVAADRVYVTSRTSGTYVYTAGPKFKLLAHNIISDDSTDFNGSPAIVDDQLFLRSNVYLYCVQKD